MRDLLFTFAALALGYVAWLSYDRQGAVYTAVTSVTSGLASAQKTIEGETPQEKFNRCLREAMTTGEPDPECDKFMKEAKDDFVPGLIRSLE